MKNRLFILALFIVCTFSVNAQGAVIPVQDSITRRDSIAYQRLTKGCQKSVARMRIDRQSCAVYYDPSVDRYFYTKYDKVQGWIGVGLSDDILAKTD